MIWVILWSLCSNAFIYDLYFSLKIKLSGEMMTNSRRIPNPELSDEEKDKLLAQDKYKPEGKSSYTRWIYIT